MKIKHHKKQDHGLGFKMERIVLRVLQSAQVIDYVPANLVHLWQEQDYLFCQVHRYEIDERENKLGIDFSVAMEIYGQIQTRQFGMTTSRRKFDFHVVQYPHIKQFYFVPNMDDNRIIQPVLALFKDVIH